METSTRRTRRSRRSRRSRRRRRGRSRRRRRKSRRTRGSRRRSRTRRRGSGSRTRWRGSRTRSRTELWFLFRVLSSFRKQFMKRRDQVDPPFSTCQIRSFCSRCSYWHLLPVPCKDRSLRLTYAASSTRCVKCGTSTAENCTRWVIYYIFILVNYLSIIYCNFEFISV